MPAPATGLILWCKYESDANVNTPDWAEAGCSGSVTGTGAFAAVKFNNGGEIVYTGDHIFTFPVTAAFCYEMWVKPIASSSTSGYMVGINLTNESFEGQVYEGNLYVSIDQGGVPKSRYTFPMSYGANDVFHIACVFDRAATDKIRLFKDNVEITVGSKVSDNAWADNSTMLLHLMGTSAMAYHDNLKIWSYAKTDFSDRFTEGFGPEIPTGLTASEGIYSDHVALAWDNMGADSYNIYRASTSGGTYTLLANSLTNSYSDSSFTGATHYFYKVASVIGITESDLSAYSEGWLDFTPMQVFFNMKAEKIDISNPSVIVSGFDIWKKGMMSSFPAVEHQKSFDKDRIFLADLSIDCFNLDHVFSLDNPLSLLYGIKWRGSEVKIKDFDGNKIWDGGLYQVNRDYNTNAVGLTTKNYLYEDRYARVVYVSSDWETGAEAFENICIAYGITAYDKASVLQSKSYLVSKNCYMKVNLPASTDMASSKNIISVFETIGKMCGTDIFEYAGKFYFRVWQPRSALLVKTLISDGDIMESPVVGGNDKILINDYSISYDSDGDVPATDSANGNIGELSRTVNGVYCYKVESSDIITLKDLASAIFTGEVAIKQKHRNLATNPQTLNQVVFSMTMESGIYLDLLSFFNLTFSDEGWTEKPFEVFGLRHDFEQKILTITAYETAS